MRKIVYIFQQPIFGGPQNQLIRTCKLLEDRGWSVSAISPEGSGADRLREAGVQVVPVELNSFRRSLNLRLQVRILRSFLGDVLTLAGHIRQMNADVVQIHGLINLHGAIASRLARTPLVWQILDTRTPVFVRYILMPLVVLLSSSVMFTGDAVRKAHPLGRLISGRSTTYVPPVDVELFSPVRKRQIPRKSNIVIGTLGNINQQKGHEFLIRSMVELRRLGLGVECKIYGAVTPTHAGYYDFLVGLIDELGVKDYVSIEDPGRSPEVALGELDVFCLTSVPLSEGIPTAMLEAMATGLPVVATDVGSVGEVLDERGGYIVAPSDQQAITSAIIRLIQSGPSAASMGSSNRDRAINLASAQVVAKAHADVYLNLIR